MGQHGPFAIMMWTCLNSMPNYLSSTPHQYHPPQLCIMFALEPRSVGLTPNPELNSATTAVLSAEIEALTAAKSTVEITPVKATFESAITILALVRVRTLVYSFACIYLPAIRSERDDERRCARGTSQILCPNVPHAEERGPGEECG